MCNKLFYILWLILPFAYCQNECTVGRDILGTSTRYNYYTSKYETETIYSVSYFIKCVGVPLDGRNPVKTKIKYADFDKAKDAAELFIINSTVEFVEKEIFDSIRSINILTIDRCGVANIQEDSFQDFISLNELVIINNPLSTLKTGTLHIKNLKGLNLYNNKFTSLNNIDIPSSLETLNVSYNKITNLEPYELETVKNLEKLDLSGNDISYINTQILETFPKLTELYLRNNSLNSFKFVSFKKPINYLDLSYNFIDKLDFPKNGTTIYNLNISENQINSLLEKQFINVKKLYSLNLDRNFINYINVDAFEDMSNLTELYLSENEITEIYVGTFHPLSALKHLNLSWNKINSLEAGVFSGLNNLEVLDLSNNKLYKLSKLHYYSLRNLQELYLHGNSLQDIDSHDLTSFLTNLRYLSFEFEDAGCENLGYTVHRLTNNKDIEVKRGQHLKAHNVHGLACNPDIKGVKRDFDDYQENIFALFTYFPIIQGVLIVLVIIASIFLIIKCLAIFHIDIDYCRNRYFNKDMPSCSLTRLTEHNHE